MNNTEITISTCATCGHEDVETFRGSCRPCRVLDARCERCGRVHLPSARGADDPMMLLAEFAAVARALDTDAGITHERHVISGAGRKRCVTCRRFEALMNLAERTQTLIAGGGAERKVGGLTVTHRDECDRTHTGFAAPCNTERA